METRVLGLNDRVMGRTVGRVWTSGKAAWRSAARGMSSPEEALAPRSDPYLRLTRCWVTLLRDVATVYTATDSMLRSSGGLESFQVLGSFKLDSLQSPSVEGEKT